MKKRFLSLLLCLVALCATIALAHAVEPRMPAESCPYCGEDVRTSITYEATGDYENSVCKHGLDGDDVYEFYEKVEIHTCSAECSYREYYYTGEFVLRYDHCEGDPVM